MIKLNKAEQEALLNIEFHGEFEFSCVAIRDALFLLNTTGVSYRAHQVEEAYHEFMQFGVVVEHYGVQCDPDLKNDLNHLNLTRSLMIALFVEAHK